MKYLNLVYSFDFVELNKLSIDLVASYSFPEENFTNFLFDHYMTFFVVVVLSAMGEQLIKSQSADTFVSMEMDTGVSNTPRSRSWLGTIGSSQREMDTASSHGPHMQDAFLSPLLSKG